MTTTLPPPRPRQGRPRVVRRPLEGRLPRPLGRIPQEGKLPRPHQDPQRLGCLQVN